MTCNHDFDPGYALEKTKTKQNPKIKKLKSEEFLVSNNSEWDSETRSGIKLSQNETAYLSYRWGCLEVEFWLQVKTNSAWFS